MEVYRIGGQSIEIVGFLIECRDSCDNSTGRLSDDDDV
jgi:hypothetical protein